MAAKRFDDLLWWIQKVILFLFVCAVFTGTVIPDLISTPVIKEIDLPPKTVRMKFLDLSAWNNVTDWKKIKNSGVDGVILRIGRYNLGVDPRFDEYYNCAKEQGLYVGCYYFMNATTENEARSDAKNIIDLIKQGGYKFELPVFYDVEDDSNTGKTVSHLSRKQLTQIVKAFCEEMKKNNYYAGFYCNLNFAAEEIDLDELKDYPLWLAAWNREYKGTEYINLTLWQATDQGVIPGVDDFCDVNYCFVDFEGYIKSKGYNNY